MTDSVRVVSLPGDGIGPEVCRQGVRVLELSCKRAKKKLEIVEMLLGGCALDRGLPALPDETRRALEGADAVLLGSVGLPKYDGQPGGRRPEKGLLDLRMALGVYANLRPVRAVPVLANASPLKEEILRGTDMVVVRELLGDVYFGEPRGFDPDGQRGFNTMTYSVPEVERIAKIAFEMARKRRKLVTSVDKANVLETSQLWRRVVTEIGPLYPDVKLELQYVDNVRDGSRPQAAAVRRRVASNIFGDILTDEASVHSQAPSAFCPARTWRPPRPVRAHPRLGAGHRGQGHRQPLGTIASAR